MPGTFRKTFLRLFFVSILAASAAATELPFDVAPLPYPPRILSVENSEPVVNQPVTVTLAAVVILAGIAFRAYAVRTLGRYFTNDVAVSADQPVIQAGPYRLIRHPAYTGTLLSALGVGLGMTNWLSLIAVAAGFLVGHLNRSVDSLACTL